MKFFLVNQYSGNKGDRAVLYAMCRLLEAICPDAEITVSTSDASLWSGYAYYESKGMRFVPWSWDYDQVKSFKLYWRLLNSIKKYTFTIMRETYLRGFPVARFFANNEFYRALKAADVVISVGGHHFTTMLSRDLVSGINFDAMTILPYKKMICFSQSFGPFEFHNIRNRKLTQKLLSECILMPRESTAKNELERFLGKTDNIHSTYESVLSLSNHIKYRPAEARDNAVGIAIYCTQARTPEAKDSYQKSISGFCNHVIAKGYSVRFFPMEIKHSAPDDRKFIHEIISKTDAPEMCKVYDDDMETLEHLEEVSKCKVFLGHKTHSTIFALATGTPLIAIAYHPKTIEFLRQFGLEDNVVDDKHLSSEILCDIFTNVADRLSAIGTMEYESSLRFARQIQQDLTDAINSIRQ